MSPTASPENDRPAFFLVSLPGLEDLVAAELADWFPDFEAQKEHGGVTVRAPLADGLAMNLALKTPTRILLRVANFRCRDFPKLFNTVKSIPWREWVDPACELEVHVSTRLSRLKIKKRIEETCEDAWMEYREEQGKKAVRGRKAALYVRFLNDECMLSLDTSGERLHKRGLRMHIGEAPLRETIAASLLQLVARHHGGEGAANIEIVDPMMGSGTFLLEAEGRGRVTDQRDFAFDTFATKPTATPTLKVQLPPLARLIGFEHDAKTFQAAQANLQAMRAQTPVDLRAEDIFTAEPLPPTSNPRWLFANPPYGERLRVKEPLPQYYARLFAAAERVAHPDRACFLLPSKAVKGRFELPRGWKVLEKRPFVNGGIPVVAFVFGRSS